MAKSTFGSENVKKMLTPEHFFNFRCRKIVRRCGEKHIWKSKSTKYVGFEALFDVLMSKNCTPLWRKAHLEVKMLKNGNGKSSVASHHCIRSSHSFVAYGKARLHVSLITLCVSSDRKCSRQVDQVVDHDG